MGSIDMHSFPLDEPVELIFLGTGTSSTVPHVDCLTAPPDAKPCKTCLSTLYPEGKRNIRVRAAPSALSSMPRMTYPLPQRNTSVVMRIRGTDGEKKYVIRAMRSLTSALSSVPGPSSLMSARAFRRRPSSGFQSTGSGASMLSSSPTPTPTVGLFYPRWPCPAELTSPLDLSNEWS